MVTLRKSRVYCSIHDLQNILKHSGRHAMLSRLASLSILSLQKVDKEADDIVIRTHQIYEVASIRHVFRPHIDLESDHQRHYLKISFLNTTSQLESQFSKNNKVTSYLHIVENTPKS